MNLLKFTRYAEWWEYKLVPLVSIAYATFLFTDIPLDKGVMRLLVLLPAIITGAVYVSVINDLTDIKEDAKAGKQNRIAHIKPLFRVFILFCCVTVGIYFGYLIYPDLPGLFFYSMAWVVFSLYSIPPFRLKKRGILGVFCDAAGAHLFPGLLITTNLIYFNSKPIHIWWYVGIGLWAFLYGLRGILWHQFYDRENDIRSGTTTFASNINPANFRTGELIIFTLELISLSLILYYILNIWIVLALVFYAILVLIRKFIFKYRTALIIAPHNQPYQLLMNDFYLVFFPLSLLCTLISVNNFGWLVLLIHLILFPGKIVTVLKDIRLFFIRTAQIM